MLARIIHHTLAATTPALKLRATEVLAGLGIRPGRPTMYANMARLHRLGFRPRTILDVGAFRGEWTREALDVWPDARVIMFEARSSETQHLQQVVAASNDRASFRTVLLGAERKDAVDFYDLDGGSGSSVLAELTAVPRRKVMLPMRRLDDEAGDLVSTIDLLKLDVQGFELSVMNGAPVLLRSCEVVVIEVALLPYNVGAPLFDDVAEYMHKRNFALFDIATLMRDTRDRVFHADFVFVRRESKLRA